jgi:hypothetical protein
LKENTTPVSTDPSNPRERANLVFSFCDKLRLWAGLMSKREAEIGEDEGRAFDKAHRIIGLAITKSCLLDRMVHGDERPSQTQCPVHKGSWSGIHFGWPDMFWSDGSPMKESEQCRKWYDEGCRCFQHGCGCTTGWQPDEHCGCLQKRAAKNQAVAEK